MSAPGETETTAEPGGQAAASWDHPRVLLVDDDANLLEALRRALRKSYDITTATSGEQAMELLSSRGPFSIIVSDLKMPGMDGITLLAHVARKNPDTVRILLTGHGDYQAAVEAVNQSYVYRFLDKPCPPETLGAALEDAARHGHMQALQRELYSLKRFKKLLDGIVLGFSALVEARDPYLAGHQARVTALSCAMAEAMGLNKNALDILRIAAQLHDIGKVYVPADFLNRPGALREEEFSVIKMHPEVGYDILKNLGEDWPVAGIIRQHHERLDGSGYPHGLKGAAISTEAAILAVADVVDAMSSHRPYRPSLGIPAALKEIELGRGVLYHPDAADACLKLFAEGFAFPTTPGAPRTGHL